MKLKQFAFVCILVLLTSLLAIITQAQQYNKLAEKVTINLLHGDADEVIRMIKKQVAYNIVYDPADLRSIRIDDLKFNAAPLGEVFEFLHRTKGLSFSVKNKTISIQKQVKSAPVQQAVVAGKVTEAATGNPLPGASVKVADGSSVLTNENGSFRIYVSPGKTLLVTYSGFQAKEVLPGDAGELLVALLPDSANLNEVVVVGYGTQRKEKITGAVATISGTELQKSQVGTFTEAMVGKLPGVQISTTTGAPGAAPSIRVRGTGSITAGNEPLYVVDGFPLGESALSTFNTGDIESVSVLKDASATSIYGSRGSNGVVIITTKRGKAGKARVSLNSYAGIQSITKKIDLLGPQEFADFAIDARNNAWVYLGNNASDPNSVRSPLYQISPYLYDKSKWVETDWQDAVFHKAPISNTQLSVNGGSDNVKYMLSGAYYQQNGTIRESGFKRYALRGNIDAQPLKVLRLSGTFSTSVVNNKMASDQGQFNNGVLGTLINSAPIYGLSNPDGSYPSTIGFGYGVSEVMNPMAFINEDNKRNNQYRTIVNLAAELQLLKGLSFKTMAGIDYNQSAINEFFKSFVNDVPANPGHVRQVTAAAGNYSSQTDFNWLSENTLNYNVKLGDKHNIDALAGFTAQKASIENVNIAATNFPNNLVPTLNAGQISGASTLKSEWSLLSYLARVNYSFSNKYFATATIRRDGSSRFGSDNRWGAFPSISAGWMVSNEDFFHASWVNALKLRASYGLAGNNDISNYGAIGLLAYSDYVIGGTRVSGITPSTLSNQYLSWEKSEQTDLAVEAGLFHNRISLVVDVYQRVSKDLLLNVPVPSILGITKTLANIGKVRNRGLEIGLNTRNIEGNFKWSTNLNFSMNRNKVLALGADGAPIIASTSGASHITSVGEPIGNFYGYIFDGVYNTKAQIDAQPHLATDRPGDPIVRDVKADGKINTDDRTVLGNYQPDFTYGVGNEFSYGNFDLSVMIQGVQGADIMNLGMRQSLSMTGRTNNLGMARDRWRSPEQPGNGKVFSAITDVYGVRRDASSFYMQDGSYLRIRNITLGYQLPAALIRRVGMSSVRIYATAQNPFTFTRYIGYNPEVSSYHTALTPGTDYFNYPLAKIYSAGINITF